MARHSIDFKDVSRTVQSAASAADINVIVERARQAGGFPGGSRQGVFIDVSRIGDYRAALHKVKAAQDAFLGLPAAVRARFDNDPARFIDFVSNPVNAKPTADMGVTVKTGDSGHVKNPKDSDVKADKA